MRSDKDFVQRGVCGASVEVGAATTNTATLTITNNSEFPLWWLVCTMTNSHQCHFHVNSPVPL